MTIGIAQQIKNLKKPNKT